MESNLPSTITDNRTTSKSVIGENLNLVVCFRLRRVNPKCIPLVSHIGIYPTKFVLIITWSSQYLSTWDRKTWVCWARQTVRPMYKLELRHTREFCDGLRSNTISWVWDGTRKSTWHTFSSKANCIGGSSPPPHSLSRNPMTPCIFFLFYIFWQNRMLAYHVPLILYPLLNCQNHGCTSYHFLPHIRGQNDFLPFTLTYTH